MFKPVALALTALVFILTAAPVAAQTKPADLLLVTSSVYSWSITNKSFALVMTNALKARGYTVSVEIGIDARDYNDASPDDVKQVTGLTTERGTPMAVLATITSAREIGQIHLLFVTSLSYEVDLSVTVTTADGTSLKRLNVIGSGQALSGDEAVANAETDAINKALAGLDDVLPKKQP